MIHVLSLVLAVALNAQSGWSQMLGNGKSAHREPGVSYLNYTSHARLMGQALPFSDLSKTAVDSAKAFGSVQLPAAKTWESSEAMRKRFEEFRNLRFLADPDHANFKRRSTWLFPDDGCFARAALAVRNLIKMAASAPNKVFVFGDLSVKTPNAPGGMVTWWYHVAPIVEVSGQKYVLDPAIEPRHPLKLEEWLAKMNTTPQNIEVAICGSGTYEPYDTCAKETDGQELQAESDQEMYLGMEWNRLESLRRNPEQELGDNPPWN